MFTLQASDELHGVASSASKITYTIFGYLKTTNSYRILAQGQLAGAVASIFNPTEETLISTIALVNTDSVSRTFTLYANGTAAANQITGTVTLGAGYRCTLSNEGLRVTDASGVLQVAVGSGGGLSDGDKGDITVSGTGTVLTVDNDVVTFAKMQNIATDRLIGRDTAATGDPEEVSVTNGLEFTGGPAIGIANNGVTYARMQDISATARILARITAGSGDPEEATIQQILNLLLTTRGDLITRDASNPVRKALGAANTKLVSDGTDIQWAVASGCEVSRATQAVTTGTTPVISFTDADTTDTDAYHDPASNASRVVAPFTGRYSVTATANHEADASTAGARRAYLCKNAAGTVDTTQAKLLSTSCHLAGTGAGTGGIALAWTGRLTAGDYVEVFYNQTSGTSRNVAAKLTMEFLGA